MYPGVHYQLTLFDCELDKCHSREDNSKAAGGLGEPTPRLKLCRSHHFDRQKCPACIDAKNHGASSTAPWGTTYRRKSRPEVGASFRQTWYDRQAKTLEKLRGMTYAIDT